MQQQCSYGQLGVIIKNIEHQASISPAFELFNREKIKRFFTQNAIRINIFKEKQHKLFSENIEVVKDPKGDYYKTIEVDGKQQWEYISDDHKKTFEEETEKFMQLTFSINL